MTAGKIHSNKLSLFWNPQLKGASQQITGRRVKKVSSVSDRYALLQPSINKSKFCNYLVWGSKITWSVKIKSSTGWVGLGICLRSFVQKNKFDFVDYTSADHGGFIISSNGYTWVDSNPSQNFSQTNGITFSANDTIDFELDFK